MELMELMELMEQNKINKKLNAAKKLFLLLRLSPTKLHEKMITKIRLLIGNLLKKVMKK